VLLAASKAPAKKEITEKDITEEKAMEIATTEPSAVGPV